MEEVQESALPLIGKGMKIFLPADLIAYGLNPQQNRLLWVDLVDIIWIIILANEVKKNEQKIEKI